MGREEERWGRGRDTWAAKEKTVLFTAVYWAQSLEGKCYRKVTL